ncbi:MAG: TonB-dependent receptor [Balneolales bacterium]
MSLFALTDLYGNIENQPHKIIGVVVDIETQEPVSFAYIHLVEINRTATTDRDGRFQFSNVPAGTYMVAVHRIGYVTQRRLVNVSSGESAEIRIVIRPTVLTGQTVEVVGDQDVTRGSNLEHTTIHVMGDQLRRDLGVTLSETLDNQPGISQRSMGPAPGRPVIRGLGNERVLILQDGERTGDASWTSSDHAVTVDPTSAEEIEIARGPSALLYGSNAIGGVVNVVRNQIPNSVPSSLTGMVSLHGTSVNRGATAAGSVIMPVDKFVFKLDLNGRTGDNFRTPVGTLTNTSMRTTQNTFGASYIRPSGYAGISGTMYLSEYGIPPDPQGGHPEGVNIEMEKYQTDVRSEIVFNDSFFKLLEFQGSVIYYHHREMESGGITGTEYKMGTNTAAAKVHHQDWGLVKDGVIGISGEFVSNVVLGTRTPDSRIYTGSVFTMQETDFGPLHLEAGLRLDHVVAQPARERVSPTIGYIRERSFTSLASSASAIYDFGGGLFVGSTFIHSFRPPSFGELFSEGPHLASYSYEIGNPDLEPERGLGSEIFFRYKSSNATVQISGYHNYFGNYLYAQDTGQPSRQRSDLNLYQYIGTEAYLYGMELSTEIEILNDFVLDGNFSHTIGERVVSKEEMEISGLEKSRQPLPMIPPLSATLGLHYSSGPYSIGGKMRLANRQTRIGDFETETPGYVIYNLNAHYRFNTRGTFHTITFNVQNLFNETYYNHLSRIKEIFPEPGRSVNLLYRVYL